jgi:hypothetical protein
LRDKINKTVINGKIENFRDFYRGITEFKKGF